MTRLRDALVLGLLTAGIAVLLAAFALLLDIRTKSNQVQVDALQRQVGNVTVALAQTIAKANTAIDRWDATQTYDAAQVKGILHESRQTLLETHRAMYKVNTQLVPAAIDSIRVNDANLAKLTVATTDSIKDFGAGMKQVTADSDKMIVDFDKVFSDPNIPLMIASLNRTASNVETSSVDFKAIAANTNDTSHQLDLSAGYFREAVYRETRPMNFAVKTGELILGQTSNFANIWKAWFQKP